MGDAHLDERNLVVDESTHAAGADNGGAVDLGHCRRRCCDEKATRGRAQKPGHSARSLYMNVRFYVSRGNFNRGGQY